MSTTTPGRLSRAVVALGLAAVLLSACGDGDGDPARQDEPRTVITVAPAEGGHTHAPGQGHADQAGDGSTSSAGGVRLVDVRLPGADAPADVSFRVEDPYGGVVTGFEEEQTKLLHLYVVRTDLAVFRHLHPTLGADGTWTARADLGEPGDYRVIAELTPSETGTSIVLGTEVTVPGKWEPAASPTAPEDEVGDDGTVRVTVDGTGEVGDDGRMSLLVRDADGGPASLGSYLGTAAHLTGFALDDGRFVHVHPYGAPEETSDGTVLTFHTEFEQAGQYRFFVQVRVGGFLHTIPVTATVESS